MKMINEVLNTSQIKGNLLPEIMEFQNQYYMEQDVANALNKKIFEPYSDPTNSVYENIQKVKDVELYMMQKRHYMKEDYISNKIVPIMKAALDVAPQ